MIDIHSHLLPGVDDGSPSVEVSVGVLERFASEGVELLVCTPHLNASDASTVAHEEYRRIFERLRAAAPATPKLALGWEIMLDVPGADLAAPHLTLGDSRAVLVEFARTGVPARAADELFRLRMSGVVPVLAHPERYWGCTAEQVRAWRQAGAVIQMDAIMLLGSGPMAQMARQLLEEGLVDCIASDNHGDGRSVAAARDWLLEMGATEQASLLTRTNADRVLRNLDPIPVAPVRIDRSFLGRLRELVRGRKS
ncbi:MAG TPA: CpsB/CapC family capsule biosynthesis tyrosine phosphatase [Gemmatimonadaceae bacterium]|nr:CpsB/CapC family capsule biosynthesis tyrosine phosphatase [Gemmatimonadaceae bacterium]